MNKKSIVKDQPKQTTPALPVVVLTVDALVNLVERMTKLEQIVETNHEIAQKLHNSLSAELQDSVDGLYRDCLPDITEDGRLKFKAYNEAADPMDAIVVASIAPQKDSA